MTYWTTVLSAQLVLLRTFLGDEGVLVNEINSFQTWHGILFTVMPFPMSVGCFVLLWFGETETEYVDSNSRNFFQIM